MKRFVEKLGNDELAFKSMFDVVTDLVFLMEEVNGKFKYIYANKTAWKLLNLNEDIYGRTIEEVVSHDLASNMLPYYREVAKTKKAVTYTAQLVTIYGSDFIGETSLTPIKTKEDDSNFILAIVRDVTERILNERELVKAKKALEEDIHKQRRLEKLLHESEQRYKSLFEHHSDAVFSFDLNMNFISGNDAVEKITGYSMDDFMGQSVVPLLIPEYVEKARQAFMRVITTQKPEINEISIYHKNGHSVDLSVMGIPILVDGQVVGMYGIAKDITDVKKAQSVLSKMAFFDYLTELPNRRTFDDRLDLAIQESKQTNKLGAVMVLDGRKFKLINDQFGHDAGDEVIIEMAKRVQDSVRKTDTVARLGGDEMGIILPDIGSIHEAENIAKRIITSFEDPFYYKGQEIQIGTGIGISIYPTQSVDKKELFKFADIALYEAKKSTQSEYKVYKEI